MSIEVVVDGKRIEAMKWQDPYGPTHSFYLSLPHVERGIPQRCREGDYHCVRILAGHQAVCDLSLAIPVLSDVQFGIQVLGFEMPWAWNEYVKNRAENDEKYERYVNETCVSYFSNFLVRANLPKKFRI